MKNAFLMLLLVLFASTSFAQTQGSTVRWRTIVGVITAPNVDNPVSSTSPIHSGTLPWTTNGGYARVNLSTGAVTFEVDGLVLNGGDFSGTLPSGFPDVVGTLVCNAGTATSTTTLDTTPVTLDPQGDAFFSGHLLGVPPAACANPLFLIRVPAFGGRWIATGAVRTMNNNY
jgi:hypothetical protein